MRCDICIESEKDVRSIFTEEGVRLHMPSIIQQHLSFEPLEGGHICGSCWEQISNFHIFYTKVKEARDQFNDKPISLVDDNSEDGENGNTSQDYECIENSAEGIVTNNNNVFPGDMFLFLKHEHDKLLNEYTYTEKSVQELVENDDIMRRLDQLFDDDDNIDNDINHVKNASNGDEATLISHPIDLGGEQCSIKRGKYNTIPMNCEDVYGSVKRQINSKRKCKEDNKSLAQKPQINNDLISNFTPKILHEHKNIKERRLLCTDCGIMFASNKTLEAHRPCPRQRLRGHICHVCGKILKGKKAFSKHSREHATTLGVQAVSEPICPICGKMSASIKTLRHHIRYVHSAIRPHKCGICGKGFKIRQKLNEHMGTHAVGASFPCPYCSKRFRSKIHVYSHKYRMHKQEFELERHARMKA